MNVAIVFFSFFSFYLQVFDQVFHVVFIWLWDGDEQRFMVVFHLLMLGILFQYSIFACNFEVFLVRYFECFLIFQLVVNVLIIFLVV